MPFLGHFWPLFSKKNWRKVPNILDFISVNPPRWGFAAQLSRCLPSIPAPFLHLFFIWRVLLFVWACLMCAYEFGVCVFFLSPQRGSCEEAVGLLHNAIYQGSASICSLSGFFFQDVFQCRDMVWGRFRLEGYLIPVHSRELWGRWHACKISDHIILSHSEMNAFHPFFVQHPTLLICEFSKMSFVFTKFLYLSTSPFWGRTLFSLGLRVCPNGRSNHLPKTVPAKSQTKFPPTMPYWEDTQTPICIKLLKIDV